VGEIYVSPKTRVLLFETSSQTLDFEKILDGMSTVAVCRQQANVVDDLLLTTFDDDGRGKMLSTVDQRPSPVDHTQCPALYSMMGDWA